MNQKKIIYIKEYVLGIYRYIEASRGAAALDLTVKPTGYGFDPHSKR